MKNPKVYKQWQYKIQIHKCKITFELLNSCKPNPRLKSVWNIIHLLDFCLLSKPSAAVLEFVQHL